MSVMEKCMKNSNILEESVDVFISIHPQYAEKILDGLKTIELRRRFPKLDGGRLLIYSTTPEKSVIGFAEIKCVSYLPLRKLWSSFSKQAHITKKDFTEYFTEMSHGYAVSLENPKKFKKPISAEYLKKEYGVIPPQSYRYLNETHEPLFSYG